MERQSEGSMENQEEQRAKELATLIESKWPGFKVTCTRPLDGYVWHYRLENTPQDTRDFNIRREVFQDHNPQQIMNGLEAGNWMLVLGECRGKTIPTFTNEGWH